MAQHEVNFTIPERPLGKADVEFSIKRNGEEKWLRFSEQVLGVR